MVDETGTVLYLVDFDCATVIPTICPMKKVSNLRRVLVLFASLIRILIFKGKLKRVQGSYQFSGIDVLLGDYPSPKSDLDSLGQLMLWMMFGSLWKSKTADMTGLAQEKQAWRNEPVARRRYCANLPRPMQEYFSVIETLEFVTERPDYDMLIDLLGSVAADHLGQPQQRAKFEAEVENMTPPKAAPDAVEKKVSRPKKAAVPKAKAATKAKAAPKASAKREKATPEAVQPLRRSSRLKSKE